MIVNNITNTAFSGKLCLKNSKVWTEAMKTAIDQNENIQNKLADNNITGFISKKTERKHPSYNAHHVKGDTLYKVRFVVQKDSENLGDKVKNFFGISGQKVDVNQHYHSEHTTIERLSKLFKHHENQ